MAKSRFFIFCLLLASCLLAGIMDISNWKPTNGGNVGALPELTSIDSPYGPAIQVKVLEENRYQGADFKLPEPVDLNNVGSITLRIKQTAVKKLPTNGCIHLHYTKDRRQGLFITFLITPPGPADNGWSLVTIPVDLRTFRALNRQTTPRLDKALQGNISLFGALRKPGQTMAIADIRFNPLKKGLHTIPVLHYKYLTKRTSGDKHGNNLTDGKIEEKDQTVYEQYTDDPEIVFDLGAYYLVKQIHVSAVAIPGQNFYEYQVSSSRDGKKWTPVASISTKDDSGAKKAYTVSGNITAAGQFFKIKAGRSRTDFQIHLSEISFTGKIPTQKELEELTAKNYSTGPALSGDAWTYTSGNSSLCIDKKTGIVFDYIQNGEKMAERIFGHYELSDGLKAISANDTTAKVLSGQQQADGFSINFTIPEIKDIVFTRTYSFVDGHLTCRLDFQSERSDRKIFYTATEVVIPQVLREGGIYETWGAGHDMQHKFASEVAYKFPADTGPVVIFESPEKKRTLLHFRYKHNNRHIQIGSGTITVAGIGDKRTAFLATGWLLGDGLFQLSPEDRQGSVETRLISTPGDVTAAFDQYLAFPEVKAFRSRIKRPAWIKDIRLKANSGWTGLWGNTARRSAEYYSSLIREGQIIFALNDNDWIWGDFPTEGPVLNQFGGEMSHDELLQRQQDIRNACGDKIRLSQYTWLWSVGDHSKVYKEHPEWFITKNAKGETITFFPTWGTNYYRQLKEPEAWQRVVDDMTNYINAGKVDIWYLDGGGSPSSVNWPRMTVDEPDAYDTAYMKIRENIQKKNPDAAVFFNHPENPIGDFGYLENSGGILTSNWRDGATWMYKFKLWQRPEPLFSPVYIYWTEGVDRAIRQYIVGTGLFFTTSRTRGDFRRNVPYISAVQQSRWTRLVSAGVSPNWRYAPEEQLETMPLTFGPDGWIFMKNHDKVAISRKVGFDTAPLGLVNVKKPLYHWEYSLKDFQEIPDLQNENDREKGYAASGWQSGFVIVPAYLGCTAYASRQERSFRIEPEKMKLWYVTQSPALVWSVDNMRIQLPLSKTMGVEIAGREDGNGMELTASSMRRTAELAAVIPGGKMAVSVDVNGKKVHFDTIVMNGTQMVKFAISKGESQIRITFAPAAAAPEGTYKITAAPGKILKLDISGSDVAVVAVITLGRDMVWSKALNITNGKATAEIAVPGSVTGGRYKVALYDLTGRKLAENSFRQRAGKPGTGIYSVIMVHPETSSREALSIASGNIPVTGQARRLHHMAGNVILKPEEPSVEIRMNKMLPSQYSDMAGALEIKAKRYLKVRLTGNFGWAGRVGPFTGLRNFTQRYGDPGAMAAIQLDFEGKKGYSVRSFAGLGIMILPVSRKSPVEWGTARQPEHVFTISGIVSGVSGKDVEEFWMDLETLGAPSDWTGRLWAGLRFTHANPQRFLKMEILDTADRLPDGVKAVREYVLKGGVKPPEPPKKYNIPKAAKSIEIDGKLKEADWKNAIEFSKFTLLGNPTITPPPSSIKLMRDDRHIYVGVVFKKDSPFKGDKQTVCWYNDGVELYFQKRNNPDSLVHFIIDVAGNYYAQDYTNHKVKGSPNRELSKPDFACSMAGNTWIVEMKFPISLLGSGNKVTGFNFGRNHLEGTKTQTFSVVPGQGYKNFDKCLIQW